MCTRTQTLVHSGMQQAAWHLLFEVGSHLLVHRKGQSRGQKRFPADHAAFILSSIVRFWSGGGEKRLMICREGRRFPWCAVDHASLPPPCAPCCVPCRLIYWKQDVVGLAVCRRLVPCFAALLLLSCQAVELSLRFAVTIKVLVESERWAGIFAPSTQLQARMWNQIRLVLHRHRRC
jgi:hypothetical protein